MSDEKTKKLEERCYPCPECSGSGLEFIDDLETEPKYVACDYCGGYQCWDAKTDNIYEGKCDESCGHNRERLKRDWQKM